MIGTEFLKGQGLGNRLFAYVTARCIAEDRKVPFGTAGRENLQADFLKLDLGEEIKDPSKLNHYQEKEERLYLPTSPHDMVHGIFTAGADPDLSRVPDGTLLYGNLQDPSYFDSHKEEIRKWLAVKPEYDSREYTDDNLCILNVRGSEYAGDPALFLEKKYWTDAMKILRKGNPDMRFMIVTEDEETAGKLLPGIECHHFGVEKDYVTVKNARFLIVSNSSFAFFPAYTSDTVLKVIAPKYWARHNVSDGYWASAQNIYPGFSYLGRDGQLCSAAECRKELETYRMPETFPWKEDDPEVENVRKRNEKTRLRQLALHKIQRMFRRGNSL